MFSAPRNQDVLALERQHVQNFLDNSHEFQQMKVIAARIKEETGNDRTAKHVEWLESVENYNTIDRATNGVDMKQTDSVLLFKLGQRPFNFITFFGSYVSDHMMYNYHQLKLRDDAKVAHYAFCREQAHGNN